MSDGFPIEVDAYQRKHRGVYGEFGAGANARVRFIQTAMQPETLQSVNLISSIPGSEKWDVVDLFQRNVDAKRVEESIVPYLEDRDKIKFFNPLTLVVLPLDQTGKGVYKELPKLEEKEDDGYQLLENAPFYRVKLTTDQSFGVLEWNPDKCRLVAIDGQHRLSALHRIYRQPQPKVDISSWKVPVVLLVIEKEEPSSTSASLLELIRNTFVYINTQAVRVNSSREILLNDESPNAVCTQEFVRYCHQNDVKPLGDRDSSRIPLLLIDWRGDTSNERPVFSPAALKSVEEIKLWHEAYILGEDFSNEQRVELHVDDAVPPLRGFQKGGALSSSEAGWIRESYAQHVLPGLMHFLENFEPYKGYISALREMEQQHIEESDIKQYAFMQLRFGTHDAPDEQREDVHEAYTELVNEIAGLKGMLPDLIKKDIGMRGIVYALGKLKRVMVDDLLNRGGDRLSWVEFSRQVLPVFNELHAEHWFDDINDTSFAGSEEIPQFLSLVAFESNGNVTNYRITDMEGGLGSLLSIIVASRLANAGKLSIQALKDLWEEQQIVLAKTIQREARKMHKARLKPTFTGTMDQFNTKVKQEAEETVKERIFELGTYIGL
jgi:hypothetical protein